MSAVSRLALAALFVLLAAAPASAAGGELIFTSYSSTKTWTRYTLEAVGPVWVGASYLPPSTSSHNGQNVRFIDSANFGGTGNPVDFCTNEDCSINQPYAVQARYRVKAYRSDGVVYTFYWDLRDITLYSEPNGYGTHCGSPDINVVINADNSVQAVLPKAFCADPDHTAPLSGTFEVWDYLNAGAPDQSFEAPLYGLYTDTVPQQKRTFNAYPSYEAASGPNSFTWRFRYKTSYGTTNWTTESWCNTYCSFYVGNYTEWYEVEVTMNGRVEQTTAHGSYLPQTEVRRFYIGGLGGPALRVSDALTAPTPNPAVGRIALPLETADPAAARLWVFDALGREVAVGTPKPVPGGLALDVSALPAGLFVYRIEAADGDVRTGRFTVVR